MDVWRRQLLQNRLTETEDILAFQSNRPHKRLLDYWWMLRWLLKIMDVAMITKDFANREASELCLQSKLLNKHIPKTVGKVTKVLYCRSFPRFFSYGFIKVCNLFHHDQAWNRPDLSDVQSVPKKSLQF